MSDGGRGENSTRRELTPEEIAARGKPSPEALERVGKERPPESVFEEFRELHGLDASPAAVPDVTALAQEMRALAHRAVTEGVNLKYVDRLRQALYAAADREDALLAELERLREGVNVHRAAILEQAKRASEAEAELERLRQERDARTFQGHPMEGQWYSHRELLMILRALGASEPQIDKARALVAK